MKLMRRVGCIAIIFALFLVIITMHAMAQETGTTHGGKSNAVGIITGGVARLVVMTPASGFVGPTPVDHNYPQGAGCNDGLKSKG